jgi:hypothetical protein
VLQGCYKGVTRVLQGCYKGRSIGSNMGESSAESERDTDVWIGVSVCPKEKMVVPSLCQCLPSPG